MKCLKCGFDLSNENVICPNCGQQIPGPNINPIIAPEKIEVLEIKEEENIDSSNQGINDVLNNQNNVVNEPEVSLNNTDILISNNKQLETSEKNDIDNDGINLEEKTIVTPVVPNNYQNMETGGENDIGNDGINLEEQIKDEKTIVAPNVPNNYQKMETIEKKDKPWLKGSIILSSILLIIVSFGYYLFCKKVISPEYVWIFCLIFISICAIICFYLITEAAIYHKLDYPWWGAYIPLYSIYIFCKIGCGKGYIYFILYLIGYIAVKADLPLIDNLMGFAIGILQIVCLYNIGRSFGRFAILSIFFPFITYPIYAFSKKY